MPRWGLRAGSLQAEFGLAGPSRIDLMARLAGLVIPDQYSSLLGVEASVGGQIWARGFGAVSVGLGAMFWMMDRAAIGRPGGPGRSGQSWRSV